MKKLFAAIAVLALAGCSASATSSTTSSNSAETSSVVEAETTDALTGASSTRTVLSGDDYDAAIENLVSLSNDLATQAETEESGYEAPESETYAQVLSVNTDGSVAMSTIHAWKVEKTDDGAQITVVMTDGRTISNLIHEADRGTIIIHGDAYYILHIENTNTVILPYSEEDYEAGKFNSAYSGAEEEKNEYTVTFNIYELESTYVYMFD